MSYYAIIIRPSEEFSTKAAELQKRLKNILVHAPSLGFHCTVYSGNLSSVDDEIIDVLSHIDFQKFNVTTKDVALYDGNHLASIIDKNKHLIDMHRVILDSIEDFIEIPEVNVHGRFKSRERTLAFKQYGSVFFGSKYSAHISLGTIVHPRSNRKTIKDNYDLAQISWIVNKYYVAKSLPKTVTQSSQWAIVKEFNLHV